MFDNLPKVFGRFQDYQWWTDSVQKKLIYVFGGNRRDGVGDNFTGPMG